MQQEAMEAITNNTTTGTIGTSTATVVVATTTIADTTARLPARRAKQHTIREHERSAKARASRPDNAAGTYPAGIPSRCYRESARADGVGAREEEKRSRGDPRGATKEDESRRALEEESRREILKDVAPPRRRGETRKRKE